MRALALVITLAAAFVAAAAAKEIEIADGVAIPAIRPCVDIVARGELQSIGEPEPLPFDEDDLIGHEIYTWRFTKRAVLVGDMPEATRDLIRSDHALVWPQPRRENVLVLLAGRQGAIRFVDSEPVRTDEKGHRYVPIFDPEHVHSGSRSRDWRPEALARFAKPVPQGSVPNERDDDRVIARLYLEDIPALLEAARAEDCWR